MTSDVMKNLLLMFAGITACVCVIIIVTAIVTPPSAEVINAKIAAAERNSTAYSNGFKDGLIAAHNQQRGVGGCTGYDGSNLVLVPCGK